MTYKDCITEQMTILAKDPKRRFLGYNVKYGLAGGTLAGVPEDQLIETPVAENLMTGLAIGLSIAGYLPVLYFERFDFVLNAMDAIVNHLDKISELSDTQFNPSVIIRVVIGNKKGPLFTGAPHTQNLSSAMRRMVKFPVVEIGSPCFVRLAYANAIRDGKTAMLVEFKDLYGVEL